MNKVAAVVVTYNRLEMLKNCLQSLITQSVPCDILIVDNASEDGTGEYVRDTYNNKYNIYYKNTGANIGGAGGFNFGMKWAVEIGYDFVWVMDDDCEPLQDALKEFIDFDKQNHGKYGFLSSKTLWKDNSICAMNIQRKTMYKNVGSFDYKLIPITMASFVSLFIPAEVIRIVGLPIKEFFIWTDDWEFTRRISIDYTCYLINSSVVIHKCGSNIGANIVSAPFDRLQRFYYLYRNDVYLYRREGICGLLYEIIRLLWHCINVIVFARDNKFKRIEIIIVGTIRGLKFHPAIEYIN